MFERYTTVLASKCSKVNFSIHCSYSKYCALHLFHCVLHRMAFTHYQSVLWRTGRDFSFRFYLYSMPAFLSTSIRITIAILLVNRENDTVCTGTNRIQNSKKSGT